MSGGSNNSAQKEAQRQEEQRIAAIRGTQAQINQVFNDPQRAADIADFVNATREYKTQELDEQKALNDRQLSFALARAGQVGGSTQVDQQAKLARDYAKGILMVDRQARGAGAEIEAADQDARGRLIQLATSGLDTTTAAQQSAAAMRTALESSQSSARAQGIGDIFGQFTKYYQDSRDAAVRRRADRQAYGLYGGAQSGAT